MHGSTIAPDRVDFHRHGIMWHHHVRITAIQFCRQRQGGTVISRRMRGNVAFNILVTGT